MKARFFFLFLILNSQFLILNCFAQWQPDVRLTNDPALSYTSYNNAWCIASSENVMHVVWYDSREWDFEIYYKRSTDGGVNWEADTRLTNNSADSYFPSISVYGQGVHVVWQDNRDGNAEIYYKRNPTGNPIGIININAEIPKEFSLYQNYPNPFNPMTKIKFEIPPLNLPLSGGDGEGVLLKIYDILGREVETLVNEQLKHGTYEIDWDATNYPSGVYFYQLTVSSDASTPLSAAFTETKKMVLIK